MNMKKSISQIAAYSFTCALFFYVFIHDQLLANFSAYPSWAKLVVEILSAMGVYTIVFEIFFFLYSKYFYRIFHRRLDMGGEWYQIFEINEYDDRMKGIRHGPCKIDATYEGISLSGENYRINQEFSSSWQSDVSTINGDTLTLLYVSEGVRRQNSMTRGTMSFHITGLPPKKLVGNFADSTPAANSGPITLFRDKSEYENRLTNILKSIKDENGEEADK